MFTSACWLFLTSRSIEPCFSDMFAHLSLFFHRLLPLALLLLGAQYCREIGAREPSGHAYVLDLGLVAVQPTAQSIFVPCIFQVRDIIDAVSRGAICCGEARFLLLDLPESSRVPAVSSSDNR